MMTVLKRIKVSFSSDGENFVTEDREIEIDDTCSGYTAQTYFDAELKHELLPGHAIMVHWYNGKNYEFRRRKTDGDQRHEEKRS